MSVTYRCVMANLYFTVIFVLDKIGDLKVCLDIYLDIFRNGNTTFEREQSTIVKYVFGGVNRDRKKNGQSILSYICVSSKKQAKIKFAINPLFL